MGEEKTETNGNPEGVKEDKKDEATAEASTELIDKANAAAERIEKANEKLEANLARQEKLAVENRLGGTADAGGTKKTDDEQAIDAAKKLVEGTGLNPFAEPAKK